MRKLIVALTAALSLTLTPHAHAGSRSYNVRAFSSSHTSANGSRVWGTGASIARDGHEYRHPLIERKN